MQKKQISTPGTMTLETWFMNKPENFRRDLNKKVEKIYRKENAGRMKFKIQRELILTTYTAEKNKESEV